MLEDIFRYEMWLSSLFDTSGLFREANKPILADSLWTAGSGAEMPTQDEVDDVNFVMFLMVAHSSSDYTMGKRWQCICNSYIDYVQRKYTNPIVLFDGYEVGPSIKDVTHHTSPKIKMHGGCPGEL